MVGWFDLVLEDVVGNFINVVLLWDWIVSDMMFVGVLKVVNEILIQVQDFQLYLIYQLVEELGVDFDLICNILFDVFVVFQFSGEMWFLCEDYGFVFCKKNIRKMIMWFDFLLDFYEENDGLLLEIQYFMCLLEWEFGV